MKINVFLFVASIFAFIFYFNMNGQNPYNNLNDKTIKRFVIYRKCINNDYTKLNECGKQIIEEVYSFFKENPNVLILISGNSHNKFSFDSCQLISKQIANIAFEELHSMGINEKNFIINYKGALKSIAPNTDEKNLNKNLRIEINIIRN